MNLNSRPLISLFAVALVQRLIFASVWLQDWDSVQFALGMRQFNVVLHQPHPPGYPIYILLANTFNIFFQNNTSSLVCLSVLTGALIVIPLYLLTKKMFDELTAVIAVLLYLVLPVSWMMSEVAASNIPGLFFLTTWVLFVYLLSNTKKVYILGLMAGLIMGVRASDFPIILAILCLMVARNFSVKYFLSILFSFIFGLGIWLIPTALLTGSAQYIQEVKDTSDYVRWHDTLLGQVLPYKNILKLRLFYLWNLLNTGLTFPFLILSTGSLLSIIRSKKIFREFKYQILLTWFFSYLIMLIFYYNLELAQYLLPLVIPLVIFTAVILSNFWQKNSKIISGLIIILFLTYLVSVSLPQIIDQSRNIPVTIAPVLDIKNDFQPSQTIIVSTFLYRQFQYYAPEFINYYGVKNISSPINTKYVVIDYLNIKDQSVDLKNYRLIETKAYEDYVNKFVRLNKTNVYILERSSN